MEVKKDVKLQLHGTNLVKNIIVKINHFLIQMEKTKRQFKMKSKIGCLPVATVYNLQHRGRIEEML